MLAVHACADTVVLKNGESVKGLILDEFSDRIVVSTVEGEKILMKSEIRSAAYDEEVKAIMQKARNCAKKGKYFKAYQLYEQAAMMDPELEEAGERRDHMRNYLEVKTREDLIEKINFNNEQRSGISPEGADAELGRELGLALGDGEKYPVIKGVSADAAYAGRIRPASGDSIVSVWGQMTAYMDRQDVASELLSSGEVRFEIERTVRVVLGEYTPLVDGLVFPRYKGVVGGAVTLTKKGLVVSDVFAAGPFRDAGIMPGDHICRLDGRNIRYVPVGEILDFFVGKQGQSIDVVIRRDVIAWKKDDRS